MSDREPKYNPDNTMMRADVAEPGNYIKVFPAKLITLSDCVSGLKSNCFGSGEYREVLD